MPVNIIIPPAPFPTVTMVAAETLAMGDLLCVVNSAGEMGKARSTYSADRWRVIAVALDVAIAGDNVPVGLVGEVSPVLFGSAPAAASNGSLVYLSSTLGVATLTPPLTTGNVIFTVGVLQGANGLSSSPTVAFIPQYISRIP